MSNSLPAKSGEDTVKVEEIVKYVVKVGFEFAQRCAEDARDKSACKGESERKKGERFFGFFEDEEVAMKRCLVEKCTQLYRKRFLIKSENKLIEEYAHKYSSWKEDKAGAADYDRNAMLAYAVMMICIQPWMDRRLSTTDAMYRLNVVLDYIGKEVNLIRLYKEAKKTDKDSFPPFESFYGLKIILSRVLPWGKCPFSHR